MTDVSWPCPGMPKLAQILPILPVGILGQYTCWEWFEMKDSFKFHHILQYLGQIFWKYFLGTMVHNGD